MKAIIFDFVGVLAVKNERYTPHDLVDKIDKIVGTVTDDHDFRARIISEYNMSNNEFEATIKNIANKYVPYKPIWDLIPILKEKYKLCIINNGTTLTLPSFKKIFPIDEYFDFFLSSAIEGVRKPDLEIYQIALARLQIEPKEVIFLDDNIKNIEAAERLGMKAVYWDTPERGFHKFLEIIS